MLTKRQPSQTSETTACHAPLPDHPPYPPACTGWPRSCSLQLGCSDPGRLATTKPARPVTPLHCAHGRPWSGWGSDQTAALCRHGAAAPARQPDLPDRRRPARTRLVGTRRAREHAGQPLGRALPPGDHSRERDAAAARLRELQAKAGAGPPRPDPQRGAVRARRHIPRQALEQQRARLAALEARDVASARASLLQAEQHGRRNASCGRPFAGSIEALLVEPGEYVAAGQPVMRLAAASGHEVEVRVPADFLRGLAVGDSRSRAATASQAGHGGRAASSRPAAAPSRAASCTRSIVGIDGTGHQRAGDAVEVSLRRARAPQASAYPLAAVMRSGCTASTVFRVERRGPRGAGPPLP